MICPIARREHDDGVMQVVCRCGYVCQTVDRHYANWPQIAAKVAAIHDALTTCEQCGAVIQIGDYPFCPHGRGAGVVIGDEMDQVIENNGTAHPIRFRSKAALKAHLDAHHLMPAVRHRPMNAGTDYSPHTTDWSRGIDPQTLDNVRVLLSRGGTTARCNDAPAPSLPVDLTIRELETGITGTYTDE